MYVTVFISNYIFMNLKVCLSQVVQKTSENSNNKILKKLINKTKKKLKAIYALTNYKLDIKNAKTKN